MIYEKLAEKIEAKGIKQRAIARNIGVPESTLSLYLNGKMKLPAETLVSICRFTGISVDEISERDATE